MKNKLKGKHGLRTQLEQQIEVDTMRYMLYYMDDFITDHFKLKAMVKSNLVDDDYFDMDLIQSMDFREYLLKRGTFFPRDIGIKPPWKLNKNKICKQQSNGWKTNEKSEASSRDDKEIES